MNPNATASNLRAYYRLADGSSVQKDYAIPANGRVNIRVADQSPLLADTGVAIMLTSTNNVRVVAERTSWWPGPTSGTWREAHGTSGSTQWGIRWAGAGELGGLAGHETVITLLRQSSSTNGSALVSLLFEDGSTLQKLLTIDRQLRYSLDLATEFPSAIGRRFGVLIESQGSTPVKFVAEQSSYWNVNGTEWAAGASATLQRLQ